MVGLVAEAASHVLKRFDREATAGCRSGEIWEMSAVATEMVGGGALVVCGGGGGGACGLSGTAIEEAALFMVLVLAEGGPGIIVIGTPTPGAGGAGGADTGACMGAN